MYVCVKERGKYRDIETERETERERERDTDRQTEINLQKRED